VGRPSRPPGADGAAAAAAVYAALRPPKIAVSNRPAGPSTRVRGGQALAEAELDPFDIDLLVFASASRDMVEPATAHIVQAELGSRAHAFDVTNACNSLINGIDVARSLVLVGRARRALVVTGETPTRAIRWRVDCLEQAQASFAGYTFGDAGAAVVVEPVSSGGLLDVDTETQSEHWSVGGIFGGGSRHPRDEQHTYFEGDGRALRGVFEKMGTGILDRVRDRTGLDWDDYTKVLVHQVTVQYLDVRSGRAGSESGESEIHIAGRTPPARPGRPPDDP
jgi:acyl-CoA:acyl-CoA alkyltransferase